MFIYCNDQNQFGGFICFFADLHIEVFKCYRVPPEQLHGVPGHEADSKETLRLVRAGPLGHLASQRKKTGMNKDMWDREGKNSINTCTDK